MQKSMSKQGGVIINIGDKFEEDGLCYRVLSNGSLLVLGFAPGTTKDIIRINDEVQSHSVSSIGVNAFKDTTIKKVILPNSVTSIEENAFMNCTELVRVVIKGNQLITIKKHAFAGCAILQRVVSERSANIFQSAFADCVSMDVFLLYVKHLREDAFNGCSMLKDIELDESCTLAKKSLHGSFIEKLCAPDALSCTKDVLCHIVQKDITIETSPNASAMEFIHYGVCVQTR